MFNTTFQRMTALAVAFQVLAIACSGPAANPSSVAPPAERPGSDAVAGGGGLSGTIKIVSSLPRTGSAKGQSDTMVHAMQMAIDEVHGQIGGATIAYDDLDDATPAKGAWDAGKEAENANKAVNDPEVMVYLGTYNSGAAKVSIPILNRAGLAMISPANSYPGLTKPGQGEGNEPDVYYPTGVRNYLRTFPADDLEGAVGASWAKQIGATRIYVLDDTELYGHGVAAVFSDVARGMGLHVIAGPEGVDPRASDYRAVAARIRASGADLVYFGGITQNNAGKLLKDIRAINGDSLKFMAPAGLLETAFLNDAGEAGDGAYITFGGVAASKLTGPGAAWYQAYKQQYGEPEAWASYSYDAMKVCLDAIRRAGVKDRARIREALFATRDFDGVLGRWSFDQNGDTTLTTMSGRQIKHGTFDEANAITLEIPH
jgi:branched-chain amino acid transport system substrate-binding protein